MDILLDDSELELLEGEKTSAKVVDLVKYDNSEDEGVEEVVVLEELSAKKKQKLELGGEAVHEKEKEKVDFSVNLKCSICFEVLYDPIALVPCAHVFCSETVH